MRGHGFGRWQAVVWVTFVVIFLGVIAPAGAADDDVGQWLETETKTARTKLLAATLNNGAVIASPSQSAPNYYFHWVRDGAVTTDALITLYAKTQDPAARRQLFSVLRNCADFSARLQETDNPSTASGRGLGEPKFLTTGAAFTEAWGRPQDDGPALRALTFIRLANVLLDEGDPTRVGLVTTLFYDSILPTRSLIKRDLEYVSHNWQSLCVDLWEEVDGHHFYTRMTQRKALTSGAKLARRLNDPGAADWYEKQAALIEQELAKHWDPTAQIIRVTRDRDWGVEKPSGLDTAVILAVLHATPEDGKKFGPTDDAVLATAAKLTAKFDRLYKINQTKTDGAGRPLGVAVGRYPEDVYGGGAGDDHGNPWVLCTLAIGELYYRVATDWGQGGQIKVSSAVKDFLLTVNKDAFDGIQVDEVVKKTNPLFAKVIGELNSAGDRQLRRVSFHAFPNGSLSEQFNRETGFMQGAKDLTWSYVSVITTASRRPGAAHVPFATPAGFEGTHWRLQLDGKAKATNRPPLPPPERMNRAGVTVPLVNKP